MVSKAGKYMNFGGSGKDYSRTNHIIEKNKKIRKESVNLDIALTEFKTKEEVDNYLSGDTIECLICGKNFKSLSAHLKTHNITAKEYKLLLGIPMSRGLCSPAWSQAVSEKIKEQHARGERGVSDSFMDYLNSPKDFSNTTSKPKYWNDMQVSKASKGGKINSKTITRSEDGRFLKKGGK